VGKSKVTTCSCSRRRRVCGVRAWRGERVEAYRVTCRVERRERAWRK
jgi:hypothetical protein